MLLLVAAGVGWGLTVSLATIATRTGIHPFSVSFWSAAISVVLLTVYLLARRIRPPWGRSYLVFYLVTGFLGTALPHVLSFYAAIHLPAGLRAIVFAMVPIVTMVLSILLAMEKPSLIRAIGIGLGFGAIVLLFDPGATGDLKNHLFWILIAFGAVVSYAVEGVYIVLKRPPGADAMTTLWGMNVAALLMYIPLLLLTGTPVTWPPPWGQAEGAILLMTLIHVGCYASLLVLLHRGGAVFASQISYIVTPAGVIWGVIVLDEAFAATVLISMVLVLAGLVLIRPSAHKNDP